MCNKQSQIYKHNKIRGERWGISRGFSGSWKQWINLAQLLRSSWTRPKSSLLFGALWNSFFWYEFSVLLYSSSYLDKSHLTFLLQGCEKLGWVFRCSPRRVSTDWGADPSPITIPECVYRELRHAWSSGNDVQRYSRIPSTSSSCVWETKWVTPADT